MDSSVYPCPMCAHVCSASAKACMGTNMINAGNACRVAPQSTHPPFNNLNFSCHRTSRPRTPFSRIGRRRLPGERLRHCSTRSASVGCVLELLEAALRATTRRLAATRRCAKATCNAMDTGRLVTKACRCVASPRCSAQSARAKTHPPVCKHCADACVEGNQGTHY